MLDMAPGLLRAPLPRSRGVVLLSRRWCAGEAGSLATGEGGVSEDGRGSGSGPLVEARMGAMGRIIGTAPSSFAHIGEGRREGAGEGAGEDGRHGTRAGQR
mmetsp:Transcript_17460/g.41762  ORF Transcript_17460/g.41762 Transcript_17460/m.41762 type:complete len:101 (-) Transcript_17460:47-349(-)